MHISLFLSIFTLMTYYKYSIPKTRNCHHSLNSGPGSTIFTINKIIDFMSNTVNIGLFLDSRRELVKKGAGIFGVKIDLRCMGPGGSSPLRLR